MEKAKLAKILALRKLIYKYGWPFYLSLELKTRLSLVKLEELQIIKRMKEGGY